MKEYLKHCIKLLYNDNFKEDIYQLREFVYNDFEEVKPYPPINFLKIINSTNSLVEAGDLYDLMSDEINNDKVSKIQRGRENMKLSSKEKYFNGYYGYKLKWRNKPINYNLIEIASSDLLNSFLSLYSNYYSIKIKTKNHYLTQLSLNHVFSHKKNDLKGHNLYLFKVPVVANLDFKMTGDEKSNLYNKIIKKWFVEDLTIFNILYDKRIQKNPFDSFIKACCVFELETIHPKFFLPPFSKQIIFISSILKEFDLTKFKLELLLKELKKDDSTKKDVLDQLHGEEIQNKINVLSKTPDIPMILIPGYLPSEKEWSKLRTELKERKIAKDESSKNITDIFYFYLEKNELRITYQDLAARHYKEKKWYSRWEKKKDEKGYPLSDDEIKHRMADTIGESMRSLVKELNLPSPKRGKRKS